MAQRDSPQVRTALRSALTDAMKRRDRETSAVFRATLGAIDNGEAVADDQHPDGAIESAVVGVGRRDVPREDLTEQDMIKIVAAEVRDVVDWPMSAASFLRQASRFTAPAPEIWVVLISEEQGWMWMRQRLRHTNWDPDHTLVIAIATDISDPTHH